MNNVDNFWLCMDEPTNLMVITAFMEFDEPIDFERLKSTIDVRLARFDRFRKRVVKPVSGVGVPHWEFDRNYDIRSHVHRLALPSPGDKAELQEMVSNLTTAPLDLSKPLWQVYLIENYENGCVVFFKIHHCIADGIALIHVLLSAADTEANAPWPESRPVKKEKSFSLDRILPFGSTIKSVQNLAKSTRKVGKLLAREGLDTISHPGRLVEMTKAATGLTADAASLLSRLTIMPSDPDTPFKGRLGVRKTVAWTEPMPLDKIKTVGRAIDTTTLNDVLIATVTGALRRYLKKRNVRVNDLDLRVAVPVNIRKPGTEFELGNKFSTVFLALPVYLEDPVLRLKEVKRRMDNLKHSMDAVVGYGLMSALGVLPPNMAKKAAHLFGNKASGVMTNVPGPRQPLYFSGSKIRNLMFWVPRAGKVGLGISILSYDGEVTVGVASDEGLLPDPEVLLEGFEEEFNYLLELVKSGKIYHGPLVLHDRYQEAQQKKIEKPETRDADSPRQCKALTKAGKRCRRRAMPGSDFCNTHKSDPRVAQFRKIRTETEDDRQAQVAQSIAGIM